MARHVPMIGDASVEGDETVVVEQRPLKAQKIARVSNATSPPARELTVVRLSRRLTSFPCFAPNRWRAVAKRLNLSDREFDLVLGVFDDLNDDEIAMRLGIGYGTVRTHFERLYRKLKVRNRSSLLLRVFREYLSASHGEPYKRRRRPP